MRFVRLGLSILTAGFFVVAGAQMHEPGSGVDASIGLLAYGAACAGLAYGAGGLRQGPPQPPAPTPARSFYEEA